MTEESDRPDDSERKPSIYWAVPAEKLEKIIAEHLKWLATNYEKGQRADLYSAYLEDVILAGINLVTADLGEAYLQGANLRAANLEGANLRGADLQGADLRGADLGDADLRYTELGEANLRGTNFLRAHVRGANLAEAKNLTQDQIDGAYGNAETSIPENLRRPTLWDESDGEAATPKIPSPSSAPIKTRVSEDRVVLDDGVHPHSDTERGDLEIHWGELKRDTDDLSPRLANALGLVRRVRDFSDALGDGADGFNEILLGLRGVALGSAVARAEKELLGDTLGHLEGLLAKYQIFMRHFPKWLNHLAPDEAAEVTAETVEKTRAALGRMIEDIKAEPELFDPRIPETLESLKTEASEQGPSARTEWLGVYRGLNDVLHSLATFAVRTRDEVRKQGPKRAAAFLLSQVGTGLTLLVGLMPAEFGWLTPILAFLRRVTGDDGGKSDIEAE